MSNLQRKVLAGGMGGMPPPSRPNIPGMPPLPSGVAGGGRRRPGSFRRRSYSPVSWNKYWQTKSQVDIDEGSFTVYSRGEGETLALFIHGGGYSGLTWSQAGEELSKMVDCRVAALDLRGHGETVTTEGDMARDNLSKDIRAVADKLMEDGGQKNLVLIGHSLGGAVAVAAAKEGGVAGLVVIDVVEGTALESLTHMQGFLRSRPQQFRSISHAIEWCVRSGQARNLDSAKVSMPGQIKDKDGRLVSSLLNEQSTEETKEVVTPGKRMAPEPPPDSIQEEDEDAIVEKKSEPSKSETPTDGSDGGPYTWAVDLSKTEAYWTGWFADLSTNFLSASSAKLLLLAGVDRLDTDLTVGQMQGKFQMIVLPQVGHAIQEDSPDKVAEAVANFLVRNRLAQSKDSNIAVPKFPLRP